MSMETLKKIAEDPGKLSDEFEEGTVIRWNVEGYTYAALKAGGRWYTTAAHYNSQFGQILAWKDLLKALVRENARDIEVAVTWQQTN